MKTQILIAFDYLYNAWRDVENDVIVGNDSQLVEYVRKNNLTVLNAIPGDKF